MTKKENIEIIKAFYTEVFNAHVNDREVIDKFMRDDYMQHGDKIPDGKEAFIGMTGHFFQLLPKMEIKKIFANDNDEVAVFFKCICEANGTENKVVDIFRLQDGKLAEHWDVVEHGVEKVLLKSGRDLFSTDSESTPSLSDEIQQANIARVVAFNEEIFNAHNNDRAVLDAFMRDDYMQHNPTAGDAKDGFIGFTDFFFTLDPKMVISKTFANEDGEVAVFFKCVCQANGMVNKVCDIYRLREGKLAEHWDVVEHGVQEFLPNGRSIF